MKRYLFDSVLIGVSIFLLASCGGKKENALNANDMFKSDSLNREEMIDENVDSLTTVYYLTPDSLGPIKIGMSVNKLPEAVDGLYSRRFNDSTPDGMAVVFADEDKEVFIAYDFGEAKVDVINVLSGAFKVKAPKGDIGIGDSFLKVLELPGVTAEYEGFDDSGMWYWNWEGLWFAPTQEGLSKVLAMRLYNGEQAPTAKDFDESVTIGFLGTGLPF